MYRATFLAIATLMLWACGSGSLEVTRPTPLPSATEPPATLTVTATATPQATATVVATSTPSRGLPVTLADVQPFLQRYVRAKWNYLTGAGDARAVYDLFSADCQRMVSLASMERTPLTVQTLFKGIQGKKVEDVEFGFPMALNPLSDSLQVRTPLSSQIRLRIDGNWQTEFQWLYAMNPGSTVDKAETLVLRPAGDSFRIATCEVLRQWDQAR